jgi:predicted HTH transcriptional regulator
MAHANPLPYIKKWIAEGEHVQQDFKLRIDEARKISKTISAFSNTIGGRILIGIKDNGSIGGIRPEEEFHMMQFAAQQYCQPPVQLQYQTWKVDEKFVLEVNVPENDKKPTLCEEIPKEWKAYLREHDNNILAPAVIHEVWKMEGQLRPERFYYSPKEQLLISELKKGTKSLSSLAKSISVKRQTVQKILAKLIRWEIVDWEVKAGIAYFSLR